MKFVTNKDDEDSFKKYWLSCQDNNNIRLDYSIEIIEYYALSKIEIYIDYCYAEYGKWTYN